MSLSSQYISLSYSEIVPDRPFTHPENSTKDVALLEYMAKRLRYVVSQAEAVRHYPRPFVLFLPEAGGRRLRVAITNPDGLVTDTTDLIVVGFCGQKRPEADRSQLDTVDVELVGEFLQHPYLLSYCSLELEAGNWCNLVLFSHPQGIMHWAASTKHAYAALHLAPQYYLAIRLHNGFMPGGLMSGNKIVLTRTKYFDYQGETIWRAVREFRPPARPGWKEASRYLRSIAQKIRGYVLRGAWAI